MLTQQIRAAASSAEDVTQQAELLLKAPGSNPMRPWLDQLASNIKREHVLRVMLNSFVWGKIFTSVQKAKAAVYRWGSLAVAGVVGPQAVLRWCCVWWMSSHDWLLVRESGGPSAVWTAREHYFEILIGNLHRGLLTGY
jgi:hypothetical protein